MTSTLISFGLFAQSIKQAGLYGMGELQPFSKVSDLKTGNITRLPYATYEPEYWLLDGDYKFKPINDALVHVGIMSLEMSDQNGIFSADIYPPLMQINFDTPQDLDGITFGFSEFTNDYASEIIVSYVNVTFDLIRTDTYHPTSWEFFTNQPVTGVRRIDIKFISTNKPYRYLRLKEINFGTLLYFTQPDIKSAFVIEEINPLSIELPIGTLELDLFSSDAAFNIVDPTGDFTVLQNKQPLDVYEMVGVQKTYIGQFYLHTWENRSDTEINFKCVDVLGVLDEIPYMGGIWIAGTTVGVLLDAMMGAINMPYELDPALTSTVVKGWIPVCKYREAIQQIAFMAGAVVTCARVGILQINECVLAQDVSDFSFSITKAQKGADQSLILKNLVTGVEITAHNYVANTNVTELYNGTLTTGTHTIIFNAPMHDLSISGATITASGANYAVLNVAATGTIVLSGQGYSDTRQIGAVYNTSLEAGVTQNIISITDATLVNTSNMTVLSQHVFNYYQQRYLQKVKLYSPDASVGDSVRIDTFRNKQIGAVVEKMGINLSGGFTVQTEATGVIL